MHQRFHTLSLFVILGLLLGGSIGLAAEGACCGSACSAKATVTAAEGLEYFHQSYSKGDEGPWSVHVIKIDRNRPDFVIKSTLAKSTVYGLSQVSGQVAGLEGEGQPLAAVNGDFFVIKLGPYRGDPIGLQITDGELVSGSPRRPAFWIDVEGQPHQGEVHTEIQVTLGQGEPIKAGLNRERKDGEAVLYTPSLGESTRTSGGLELALELTDASDDEPSVGERWEAHVAAVSAEGNTPLKPGQVIVSFGPELAEKYVAIKKGDAVSIQFVSDPDLGGASAAIGGGPILIKDGKLTVGPDKVRHPRTAVGMNDDSIFWVVVDGRQPELSIGMSVFELASKMLELGCSEAVNLDGGGSSTMWLDGKVMNSPSDGRQRSVANALVLVRKSALETEPVAEAKSAK